MTFADAQRKAVLPMTDHLTSRWLWWTVGAAVLLVALVALFVRADNGHSAPPPTTAQLVTVAELERTIASVRDQVRAEEQARAEAEERRVAEVERASRSRVRPRPTITHRSPIVVAGSDVWARLRQCEAGGDYTRNSGNGYYGAYQFARSTWRGAVTRAGHAEWANRLPSDAPPAVQDAAARQLQSERGWAPWPGCSRKLGLR